MDDPVGEDQPPPRADAQEHGAKPQGFRLISYFTATSLVAFAVVALALYVLQSKELSFFEQVQKEQRHFLAGVQADLSYRQESAARSHLLRVHEAGHVNMTRLFENVLWGDTFAPLVARAQSLSVERCRAMAGSGADAKAAGNPAARRDCFADLGRRIMAYPGFAALDARVYATMRKTTAFKIKVYDLRGLTVYSSEHSQIGEDKAENRGWIIAAGGSPASELTHRDRFSAFEGMVENRDLISSYIPVLARDGGQVIGVFEIYSDVTPFLEQIRAATATIAELNATNQAVVEQAATQNRDKVDASSDRLLAIVGGLLALLYAALLLLVRIGQRIIDRQAQEQRQSIRREAQWHREKMAALATMAANVAHEVGNPLATISVLAEEMVEQQQQRSCPVCQPQTILARTRRIAAMTREIADFAAARSESPELVDLNHMVKAVCDFMSFDHRFRVTKIEFRPGAGLPGCWVVPDRLNETLMTLLQGCAEGDAGHAPRPAKVTVHTAERDGQLLVGIDCGAPATAGGAALAGGMSRPRFEEATRLIAAMGGWLRQDGATVEMVLPETQPA